MKTIKGLSLAECETIHIENVEYGCANCPLHINGGYCYRNIKIGIREDLKLLKSTELSLNEKKKVLERMDRSIKRAKPILKKVVEE